MGKAPHERSRASQHALVNSEQQLLRNGICSMPVQGLQVGMRRGSSARVAAQQRGRRTRLPDQDTGKKPEKEPGAPAVHLLTRPLKQFRSLAAAGARGRGQRARSWHASFARTRAVHVLEHVQRVALQRGIPAVFGPPCTHLMRHRCTSSPYIINGHTAGRPRGKRAKIRWRAVGRWQ